MPADTAPPLEIALLQEVRALELTARRNVSSLLTGNYRTTVVGRGMEFHESRKYLPGDPVRAIDWKTTARLDEAYVKTFVEERQREIVVALDVSPSMHTGWQRLTKIEAAAEIAATLAVSAIDAGDKFGLVTFAEHAVEVLPPKAGKPHLFRAAKSLVEAVVTPPPRCRLSDPRAAFHAIQALPGKRFVIFVVSDFVDEDVPQDLAFLGRGHDVSLLHVHDPLEFDFGPALFRVESPEGPRRSGALHRRARRPVDRMNRSLRAHAARHRMAMESFSTADPIGPALARFFHGRRVERPR